MRGEDREGCGPREVSAKTFAVSPERLVGKSSPTVGREVYLTGRRVYPRGRRVCPVGRQLYPTMGGVYPMGRGVYPVGRRACSVGRGIYPMGRRVYPVGGRATQRDERATQWGAGVYPVVEEGRTNFSAPQDALGTGALWSLRRDILPPWPSSSAFSSRRALQHLFRLRGGRRGDRVQEKGARLDSGIYRSYINP